MDRKRVLEALNVLHAELASSGHVSDESRAALNRVSADVQRLLAERLAAGEEEIDAATALKETLLDFETEHPQLTGAINQLAAALANLGI